MGESVTSTKMSLVCGAALWLCIFFVQIGENSAEKAPVDSIRNSSNETRTVTKNYLFDPEISGFNSTRLTSGPVVLADKRTLFITNLQYKGSEEVLVFYVGTGSPYNSSEKESVAEEYFVANHTNLYVRLSENLTLDNIDFVGASLKNSPELIDYIIFDQVDKSTIRSHQRAKNEETIYRVPKCCRHNEYLTTSAKGCVEAETDLVLNLNIFESNETGLDPDISLNSSDYDLRPYFQGLKCNDNELRVDVGDELHGLIYNSSLIIQGNGILSHGEYCVEMIVDENGKHTTNALYCYPVPEESSDPNLYLPMLILSAICFAISSIAYGIILRAKDVHKICFIIFSTSMCLTFLSLIILQVQSSDVACNIFGFIFLFSTVLSFLWLLVLCLELLYVVRTPIEEKRNHRRWYWYVATSCGISTILCLISLFSGELWIPDVPDSFIKTYGTNQCEFGTSFGRTFILFAPMILSIVLSCTSLGVMSRFMNKNEKSKKIKNHVDWVVNKNTYKFLARTYIIIIIVACFWLLNIAYFSYQLGSAKTQLALDIIEASLGVVTLIGFVLNKYTLAEIKDKLYRKNQRITEEGLRLNGIPTPETPATDLDMVDDPFFQPHNRNSRLTTFGGNNR